MSSAERRWQDGRAAGQARFGEALQDDVFEAVVGAELALLGLVAGGFGLPTGVDASAWEVRSCGLWPPVCGLEPPAWVACDRVLFRRWALTGRGRRGMMWVYGYCPVREVRLRRAGSQARGSHDRHVLRLEYDFSPSRIIPMRTAFAPAPPDAEFAQTTLEN